jgi:hypothetical protein
MPLFLPPSMPLFLPSILERKRTNSNPKIQKVFSLDITITIDRYSDAEASAIRSIRVNRIHHRVMLAVLLAAQLVLVESTSRPSDAGSDRVASLTSSLQSIIDAAVYYDNVSYSFAVISDEFSVAVAGGTDDHQTGTPVTTDSMYPAGSVTKPYTAVAAMRLYDRGLLDLDEPVYKILDPWLKSQSLPPLLKLWKGDSTIKTVTSRHLLGMQAGFSDYESSFLKNWTVNHPSKDYLPMDFINALDKEFIFKPGKGAAYTGDGFVLMGLVLAAATGAKDWSDFDQFQQALGHVEPPFNGTIFMKTTCSLYPVVHQYTVCNKDHGCTQPNGSLTATPFHASRNATCKLYSGIKLKGPLVANSSSTPVANASECCALATAQGKRHKENVEFTFKGGNCSVFAQMHGVTPDPTAVSGTFSLYPPAPITPSSFVDLYQMSCLNGWTMGE